MEEKELYEFLNALYDGTENGKISWKEVNDLDLGNILMNNAAYSGIIGGYASLNKKGNKYSIVGKYKMRISFDEDDYYFENYNFLAITNTSFGKPIVFTESDFDQKGVYKLADLYRKAELEVNDVSSILDDWF